jgi:hypothetical protein
VSDGGSPGADGGSNPTGATSATASGAIPASLIAEGGAPGTASSTAVTPAGSLPFTGAPILLEVFLGAVALLAGLALSLSGRLRRRRD